MAPASPWIARERREPYSFWKVEIGIQTKLSWLWPKTEPFFSATPTTLRGWPSTSISLPIGSIVPKNASTRSVPITATRDAWSSSCWTR